ncbi:MAG TPA: hypothetical protein VJ962_01925, partial [Clostridia bacterium]|nr:hypothetical protein [Clostridia bacterium]
NCLDDENNSIEFLVDTFSKMDSCTAPFNILFAMVQGDIKINSQTISPANMDYLITFLTKRLFKCEVTQSELRYILASTYWLYTTVEELDNRKEEIFSLWRKYLINDLCLVFNAFVYNEESRKGFYGFHIKTFKSVFEDFDNLRKLADYNILTVEKQKIIDELEELQREIKNNQTHEVKFRFWNECVEKNR